VEEQDPIEPLHYSTARPRQEMPNLEDPPLSSSAAIERVCTLE
jgi:hypothetical protein